MKVAQYLLQRTTELNQHQQTFHRLFYFLEDHELLFIPEGESWAAIECIEHLNFVFEHYLPQLKAISISDAGSRKQTEISLNKLSILIRKFMTNNMGLGQRSIHAARKLKPRRLQKHGHKFSPQKAMENFIDDLDDLKKIISIIVSSTTLSNIKVNTTRPFLKIRSVTAIEYLIPHIGRHLDQAERILNGGSLAREQQSNNPDLIYPTSAEKIA
ncbi:MAG: DinB family protein [Schleiferiaceae bacterium]|jgi:hypothetical protein|nr:DinB family protein [Schleiferiaceae bacterium]